MVLSTLAFTVVCEPPLPGAATTRAPNLLTAAFGVEPYHPDTAAPTNAQPDLVAAR